MGGLAIVSQEEAPEIIWRSSVVESLQDRGWWCSAGESTFENFVISDGDWTDLAECWDHLLLDEHMMDEGRYRYRRFSAFEYDDESGALKLLPHQPYQQSKQINVLNGGFERRFDPLDSKLIHNPAFKTILAQFGKICSAADEHSRWNIKLHPYRIVASEGQQGEPAPEGLHRDGVDYIISLLVRRMNVVGGVSYIADRDRNIIGSAELVQPGDFVMGDDRRTFHGVSGICPHNVKKAFAYRDVLVIAFEKC
ncbi:2OG-Fe dioxygenase family protein [Rhizorhapis suberifaciens]|uniref:2OG-Fe dioxygenase family protein n=1 Tax=Rhizorhapis suberifaciens TaxID=13656 RepID=A0A840HZY0_9SPHN|nr:2OG-Fe dioxygenase family protein [Rhizorhapis suberifaciens]MBB4642966.1 hypothetical protein [Rhizorhapis suberifaciens]